MSHPWAVMLFRPSSKAPDPTHVPALRRLTGRRWTLHGPPRATGTVRMQDACGDDMPRRCSVDHTPLGLPERKLGTCGMPALGLLLPRVPSLDIDVDRSRIASVSRRSVCACRRAAGLFWGTRGMGPHGSFLSLLSARRGESPAESVHVGKEWGISSSDTGADDSDVT